MGRGEGWLNVLLRCCFTPSRVGGGGGGGGINLKCSYDHKALGPSGRGGGGRWRVRGWGGGGRCYSMLPYVQTHH